jgi:hypothetical protein
MSREKNEQAGCAENNYYQSLQHDVAGAQIASFRSEKTTSKSLRFYKTDFNLSVPAANTIFRHAVLPLGSGCAI